MKNSEAVINWRRRTKIRSLELLGGKCCMCGYDKCVRALDFHHINPKEKEFSVSADGSTRSWKRIEKELQKCIILCKNCHSITPVHKERKETNCVKICAIHGETQFYLYKTKERGNRTICRKCFLENQKNRLKDIKEKLIKLHGGICKSCNNTNILNLDFHHIQQKNKKISSFKSFKKAEAEAKNCILLCKNCHAETHHVPQSPSGKAGRC